MALALVLVREDACAIKSMFGTIKQKTINSNLETGSHSSWHFPKFVRKYLIWE